MRKVELRVWGRQDEFGGEQLHLGDYSFVQQALIGYLLCYTALGTWNMERS